MATSSSGIEGGYDLDFVDEPISDELLCLVCLLVLKEPQLTSCCGTHLCSVCYDHVAKKGQGCPKCRDADFTVLLNKHHRRKVLELKVRCTHTSRGCDWADCLSSLREHLDRKCLYVEVECPQGCSMSIQRLTLKHHLQEACEKRTYTCPYCQVYENAFDVVMEEHADDCPSYPVQCPNRCHLGTVDRCCLEQHLAICPQQELTCPLHHAGCTKKIYRRDMDAHMRDNTHMHLTLLSSLTLELKLDLEQKEDQLRQKEERIAQIEHDLRRKDERIAHVESNLLRLMPVPPFDMTLTNFELLRANNGEWNSSPFYSHPGGYKMCLRVCPNGVSPNKGKWLAVFFCIHKGEFDDDLTWPCRGVAVFQMLNQEYERAEHALGHVTKRSKFCLPRMYHRAIGVGYGPCTFFPISELSEGTTVDGVKYKYLALDRLHFRIASIELDKH